ncbi:MAG: hypothetical protein ACOC2K_04530 [Bacteroidota bacterium]
MEKHEIKELAKQLVEEMHSMHSAEYAAKWEGGSLFVMPGDSETNEHEIPLDKLMHKIIMIRDNLRVLEQQINSSDSLSEGEKLKFQNYITRCYGSLTSFNFLFYYPEDKFSSK